MDKKLPIFSTLFWFLFVNFFISIGIHYTYVLSASGMNGFLQILFVHAALLSNLMMLYIVVGIILYLLCWIWPKRGVLYSVPVIFMLLFQTLSFADSTIYRLYKFHTNGLVLNLFTTEGAWDSVKLGAVTILSLVGAILLILALELWLIIAIHKRVQKSSHPSVLGFQRNWLVIIIILAVMLVDKGIYAVTDLVNSNDVTRFGEIFPLYQPLTIKRTVKKVFGYEVIDNDKIKFDTSNRMLNYPKNPMEQNHSVDKPNIIMIVIDAWRYDMLTKDVTPNIYQFSERATSFTNHYSGGNASRFGVFSLLYGVDGFNWLSFLSQRQTPVLIDELTKLGYDFKILSSTKLTYPEFRKTAFVKIQDKIVDELPGTEAKERDPEQAKYFINWLKNRHSDKPFFSFMWFDAPHASNSYPDSYDKFKPSMKTINYMTVRKRDYPLIKNSYKNSIYFNDDLVGDIIEYLDKNGYLKNTIVMFTGDHGQEFYESGFFGHTSAFSIQQSKVPFVMYIPNRQGQKMNYMTSHLDVVPTLMHILNYKNPYSDYSNGKDLFDGKGHDYIVCSGWNDAAMIDGKATIVFSTETYNANKFEVRETDSYKFYANPKEVLKEKKGNLLKVMKEKSDFLK